MKKQIFSIALLVLFVLVTACAPVNDRSRTGTELPPVPPQELATQVYYYPLHEQSIEQQERDRFECYLWAKQQTGFDPSRPYLAPHQRTYIIPETQPSGAETFAGALTGAIIGAMIGGPDNSAEGALVGAFAGGALGAASDAARQERSSIVHNRYRQISAQQYATLEREANNYRRAMKACLEGRGYKVR